jgi:hypothetical protein
MAQIQSADAAYAHAHLSVDELHGAMRRINRFISDVRPLRRIVDRGGAAPAPAEEEPAAPTVAAEEVPAAAAAEAELPAAAVVAESDAAPEAEPAAAGAAAGLESDAAPGSRRPFGAHRAFQC